jgi:cephalosporin hydroxylase
MKLEFDLEKQLIHAGDETVSLYSPEGFRILSDLWVKVGWDQKHNYSFTWMGRPIIQIPDDAFRIQEVIYALKPDVIIETGVALGGSLIFSASLCKAMGKGKVVGVDIEIRPHNRKAIEAHEMFPLISLIEGSSTDLGTFDQVASHVKDGDVVLVILDSCHSYQHVLDELRMYSRLVTKGSYIVATDGAQEYLNVTPRAKVDYPNSKDWPRDNPKRAAEDFVVENRNFEIVEPKFPFNEGNIDFRITHWPSAYLKRVK